jgi:hypothetical protein
MTLFRRFLFSVAILPGLACLAPAAGQGGAATVTGPFATQVTALRETVVLLNKADHDYKGHRAKAVHELHVAIHSLHPAHKKPHPPTAKKGGNKGGNNEPQAVSDAQLAQAIKQIQVVQTQLGNATVNVPPQALPALAAAVTQLQTALKIK